MLLQPHILHAFFASIAVARGASVPLDTRETFSYAFEVGLCQKAEIDWCEGAGRVQRNIEYDCRVYSNVPGGAPLGPICTGGGACKCASDGIGISGKILAQNQWKHTCGCSD
ncbi:hypothetical protein Ptr902_12913 [Pyrenophora tritici-repentis]|nr:hypothetical protein Ptr902_12913 [Pyrenophora tritici-repentis]